MSQAEIYNTRDRSYSAWHRRDSIRRFVGIERAQTLSMIDLDASIYVEYDDGSKEPLALMETAMDVGQSFKSAAVTKKLARRCFPPIPAYVLLYTLSNGTNPADDRFRDISKFRRRRIWPEPETDWETLDPDQFAKQLVRLREWSARLLDREMQTAR